MRKHALFVGLAAGLGGLVAIDTAQAVHLAGNGIGQALVYPYYTVNAQQQTVLSVVNTTSIPKAVKVRFREGYNGREVLDFNLFLSPYDVWTGTVFALSDDGITGDGAAILTRDRSCTAPAFSESGTTTSSGIPYVAFRDSGYLTPDDGGPYTIDRTREGHFEIIAMADLGSPWAAAVTHRTSGYPSNCAAVRNLQGSEAGINPPTTGLFGTAGIINVGQGTLYNYNADALARFTFTSLFSPAGTDFLPVDRPGRPNFGDVNDGVGALAGQATAHIQTEAGPTSSTYPGADPRSRRIDAVSAVFASTSIHNEYQVSATLSANTDWVVTFPTKAFYVDPAILGDAAPIPPFVRRYNGAGTGLARHACVAFQEFIYDQEERTTAGSTIFPPPPPPPPPPSLCRQVNVVSLLGTTAAPTQSAVLGSRLLYNIRPRVGNGSSSAGWLGLSMDPQLSSNMEPHALLAANNGNMLRGLPVTGFAAISITNNSAMQVDGVWTLSNYSGTSKHRATSSCHHQNNWNAACQ